MSSSTEFEMSSEYTSLSAVMAEGLEEIMKNHYSIIPNRIPAGILDGARELFSKAIKVINGQKTANPVEEATAYSMIIDHLRETNPKRYDRVNAEANKLLYRRDIRNLASLIDNLELPRVPEDQKEYVPILRDFFKLLTETGENARYHEVVSGEQTGKYTYS